MKRKDAKAVVYCLDFAVGYLNRDTPELRRAKRISDRLAKKHKIPKKKRKGADDGGMVF